jgi:hypothetical protein
MCGFAIEFAWAASGAISKRIANFELVIVFLPFALQVQTGLKNLNRPKTSYQKLETGPEQE